VSLFFEARHFTTMAPVTYHPVRLAPSLASAGLIARKKLLIARDSQPPTLANDIDLCAIHSKKNRAGIEVRLSQGIFRARLNERTGAPRRLRTQIPGTFCRRFLTTIPQSGSRH